MSASRENIVKETTEFTIPKHVIEGEALELQGLHKIRSGRGNRLVGLFTLGSVGLTALLSQHPAGIALKIYYILGTTIGASVTLNGEQKIGAGEEDIKLAHKLKEGELSEVSVSVKVETAKPATENANVSVVNNSATMFSQVAPTSTQPIETAANTNTPASLKKSQ